MLPAFHIDPKVNKPASSRTVVNTCRKCEFLHQGSGLMNQELESPSRPLIVIAIWVNALETSAPVPAPHEPGLGPPSKGGHVGVVEDLHGLACLGSDRHCEQHLPLQLPPLPPSLCLHKGRAFVRQDSQHPDRHRLIHLGTDRGREQRLRLQSLLYPPVHCLHKGQGLSGKHW